MRLRTRTAISQLVVMLAVAASPSTASAQANITFDGMAGNISGTTIQGVTFTMSNNSLLVGGGPGCQTLVCDPSAVGSTLNQTLTLGFASPVSGLGFGVALNASAGTPSFFVQLLNASNAVINNYTVTTARGPIGNFVEGRFAYEGEGVSSAVLSFQPQGYAAFAIDNITTTPEPASLALVATGLVGVFAMARRRKTARAA